MGGGLLITMLSDVAIASDRATFGAPELFRGVADTNGEWNRWIKDGDWESHFEKEEVERLYAPASRIVTNSTTYSPCMNPAQVARNVASYRSFKMPVAVEGACVVSMMARSFPLPWPLSLCHVPSHAPATEVSGELLDSCGMAFHRWSNVEHPDPSTSTASRHTTEKIRPGIIPMVISYRIKKPRGFPAFAAS